MNPSDLKLIVREKYDQVARTTGADSAACCGGSACCGDQGLSMIGDEYQNVEGHVADADLGLGCGIPTEYAGIAKGDHVLDLGSGAGNDVFVARALVGESGSVTGIDFTTSMIEKARANNLKMGYSNVEFVQGDIEEMPFEASRFDVVVSNCVLNLVPDKNKAMAEIFRVLKPGGHFCISDVVLDGELPEALKQAATLYAGCVSGAIAKDAYLEIVRTNAFSDLKEHKLREIVLPDELLLEYLSSEEVKEFRKSKAGIYSITLAASK
jgi:ubiquinone/menaquinone biosynthesis C-methylase UbiE